MIVISGVDVNDTCDLFSWFSLVVVFVVVHVCVVLVRGVVCFVREAC